MTWPALFNLALFVALVLVVGAWRGARLRADFAEREAAKMKYELDKLVAGVRDAHRHGRRRDREAVLGLIEQHR